MFSFIAYDEEKDWRIFHAAMKRKYGNNYQMKKYNNSIDYIWENDIGVAILTVKILDNRMVELIEKEMKHQRLVDDFGASPLQRAENAAGYKLAESLTAPYLELLKQKSISGDGLKFSGIKFSSKKHRQLISRYLEDKELEEKRKKESIRNIKTNGILQDI